MADEFLRASSSSPLVEEEPLSGTGTLEHKQEETADQDTTKVYTDADILRQRYLIKNFRIYAYEFQYSIYSKPLNFHPTPSHGKMHKAGPGVSEGRGKMQTPIF